VPIDDEKGFGPAGRKGPLALFIQRNQDGRDTRSTYESLFRSDEKNSTESGRDRPESKRSFSESNRKRKNKRTSWKSSSSQCWNRRPKRSSSFSTNDSRWQQTTKSRHPLGTTTNNDSYDSTSHKIVPKRTWAGPTLKCIYCGDDVVFTNENRCEDCFANDQRTWHGRPLRVKLETPLD
jgi:hypothetical protein